MDYNNKPYGNYEMKSIDGEFLAYTDLKRMNWYLSRELANKIDDTTYQLNFVTQGQGNSERISFYKVALSNHCVVCGTDDELTRHHVVPSQYRKLLDVKYKGRNSYDIVSICNTCHQEYEREADKLKKSMSIKFGLENYTKINSRINRYHTTLKYYSNNIPEDRKETLIHFLTTSLDDTIENILKIDRYEFEPETELFMKNITDIESFIIMWRKHFLETAKPQFIAKEWVDNVENFL